MKVNELMINDWIRSSETKTNGQVCEISEDLIEINVTLPKDRQACWIDGRPQNFEGIPLTKEIILLNADRFSLKYKDAPIPFWFNGDKFFCGCESGYEIEVKYVHEVQNFLRVIGFSNEADDFIIE